MKHEETRKSLYVATHDYTSLTKVGVAVEPMKRLSQLKSQSGAELKIYYESPLLDNFLKIEVKVLDYFKDKRICGEWVNESPEEIIKYIKTLETDFNSVEYTCLNCLYENYTGEEVKEINRYTVGDTVKTLHNLSETDLGIYITDDYKFYVFIMQSKFIYHISFNVFRTANAFARSFQDRVIKIDLDTKQFKDNPKFRIKNE